MEKNLIFLKNGKHFQNHVAQSIRWNLRQINLKKNFLVYVGILSMPTDCDDNQKSEPIWAFLIQSNTSFTLIREDQGMLSWKVITFSKFGTLRLSFSKSIKRDDIKGTSFLKSKFACCLLIFYSISSVFCCSTIHKKIWQSTRSFETQLH